MTKNLTEKQQKFLAPLFDEAGGDARLAKKMAGYSDETRLSEVVKPLKDEIMEATKEYMAYVAPKAAMAMVGVVSDPTALGNRDRLAASREILDRVGVIKTEKVQVEAASRRLNLESESLRNKAMIHVLKQGVSVDANGEKVYLQDVYNQEQEIREEE